MDNDLHLYDAYHYALRDYGVTIADFENGLRSVANIIEELADTVLCENIMLSLGDDTEPIYPIHQCKMKLNGEWNEDDGQEISEFLNQFKIIE